MEHGQSSSHINCAVSHLADWSRRTSATSPHVFKNADENDIYFIDKELNKNNYAMFIRKVSPEFPDEILNRYIYEKKLEDNQTFLIKPIEMFLNTQQFMIYVSCIIVLYIFYLLLL